MDKTPEHILLCFIGDPATMDCWIPVDYGMNHGISMTPPKQ